MPSTDSWQERPLALVEHIFDTLNGNDWMKGALGEFESKLNSQEVFSAVPSLNDYPIHELSPNSLVRFRCMVQDSYDNELFMENYILLNHNTGETIRKTSSFKDVIDCPNDFEIQQDSSKLAMRQILYCVSVPAECEWTQKGWKDAGTLKLNKIADNTPTSKRKRTADDDMEIPACGNSSDRVGKEEGKRTKLTHQSQSNQPETVFNKNHPLPNESGPVCLVKVYDESATFKVNNLYEFYGILSVDPFLSDVYDTNDNEMDVVDSEERKAHHPPASIVPRLHVVFLKHLDHVNPFVKQDISADLDTGCALSSTRDCLLEILEKATLGDSLVAEYLLMHLLSRVYMRRPALPLGKFSLNICGIPPGSDYPRVLCRFLQDLVTKMHYLPMSLDTFNSGNFIPTKNYNSNRLDTGILQLSDGTHLFLDETTLKAGNLNEHGVKNIKALKDVMSFQKLDYNFQFSEVSFETDIAFIVLSEGKSILPCDCQIKLKPTSEIPKDVESYFSSFCSATSTELLNKCRCYITACKFSEYELGDEMTKVIQEDFVSERRRNAEVTAEDLHSSLVLARLMNASFCKSNLTKQTWDRVKATETRRKARFSVPAMQNGH